MQGRGRADADAFAVLQMMQAGDAGGCCSWLGMREMLAGDAGKGDPGNAGCARLPLQPPPPPRLSVPWFAEMDEPQLTSERRNAVLGFWRCVSARGILQPSFSVCTASGH